MFDLMATYANFLSNIIDFDSDFGEKLPFFPENAVPLQFPNKQGDMQSMVMPYGTYAIARTDMFTSGIHAIRIWSRSSSITQLMQLLDGVENAVPRSGVRLSLPENKGTISIYRGDPFIQRQPSDETDIQIGYVNLEIRNYVL